MQVRGTKVGRYIHRKYGDSESILTRSNRDLWKLALDLNYDEIVMLITSRKNKLKYEKNPDMITYLRNDIKILIDAYRLKKRTTFFIRNQELMEHRNKNELSYTICDLISKCGFSQNTIFIEEGIVISNKIPIDQPEDVLATCIVKEIFDKYNVNYDERELLNIYEIPETTFYEAYLPVTIWCRKNHWNVEM